MPYFLGSYWLLAGKKNRKKICLSPSSKRAVCTTVWVSKQMFLICLKATLETELSQEMSFMRWLESFERKGGAINRAALVQFCRAVMKIHQSRQNVWNIYKSIHCVRLLEACGKKQKQNKTKNSHKKSCYFASLSKKAMILSMKAILFLQNHFRKMMVTFREFGITRSIMLLIFINPKDKLSKGIF